MGEIGFPTGSYAPPDCNEFLSADVAAQSVLYASSRKLIRCTLNVANFTTNRSIIPKRSISLVRVRPGWTAVIVNLG